MLAHRPTVTFQSIVSPEAEASSPEEEEDSDVENLPVVPAAKSNGARAEPAKNDSESDVEEEEQEQDVEGTDEEPGGDAAASASSPEAAPSKAAVPVLQTPANKKTVAVLPHSVPAIAAIRTMEVDTGAPAGGRGKREKKDKDKGEKKERKERKERKKKSDKDD